ncbi:hypothetical protein [Saccharomonospora azurea]|uniref:hypothetical protein n=1 Tax=Saccharomonospora azurea TaxID=40988 RepID=UPI0024093485|nr:hypothetical protein [Saccharomonospora azurea]
MSHHRLTGREAGSPTPLPSRSRERAVIALQQQQWTTANNTEHGWLSPADDQDTVSIPCTPGDHRTCGSKRHDLRRSGVRC